MAPTKTPKADEMNTNEKLMLAMIGTADIKTDNEALAAIIGGGATANAIRQRVQKIKQQAKIFLAENGHNSDTSNTASPAPAKRSVSNGRKKSSASEDDDEETSPAKKRKTKSNGALVNGKSKDSRTNEAKSEDDGVVKTEDEEVEAEERSRFELDGQLDGGIEEEV